MFDPTLTDEQNALIDTARRFAAEKIIPVAGKFDESGEWPIEVFKEAWELGLMNVEVPEAYGGLGFSTIDGCLVSNELFFGCAGIATSIMGNHLASLPLLIAGTEGV
jgi:acyl-CoA dehydrogenase